MKIILFAVALALATPVYASPFDFYSFLARVSAYFHPHHKPHDYRCLACRPPLTP